MGTITAGAVHKKIEAITSTVFSLAKEWFGTMEKKGQCHSQQQPNKRERKIRPLSGKMKALNKLFLDRLID